ncbi:hypothetical protein M405DRAFT_886016 [Rhizopogon salebrosus TDB-379]|nr:hypothetical protein M405DRAFT_886016 [Rhizopogon salebrosus TDB-379]
MLSLAPLVFRPTPGYCLKIYALVYPNMFEHSAPILYPHFLRPWFCRLAPPSVRCCLRDIVRVTLVPLLVFFLDGGFLKGSTSWAVDHTITPAVEHQAQGCFRFHTFCASAVVDDAEPHGISIVDQRLVEDACPFGILDAAKNGRVLAYKQQSRTDGSADEIPVMDTETEEWPVLLEHKDKFDSMRFDFIAYPLRVYRDKTFVEQRDVIEALTGAVVEVYFGIRHYYLCNKKFDIF